MKKMLMVLVSLWLPFAVADHEKLETLARYTSNDAYQLTRGARSVIGNYPSHRQQYAYEHVQFLASSARRFESSLSLEGLRDHDHDEMIHRAYRKLQQDTYYARSTFEDLFQPWRDHDHPQYYQLNSLLRRIEQNVWQMSFYLP